MNALEWVLIGTAYAIGAVALLTLLAILRRAHRGES